jgi:tetratricopeptide (TPR) repeat protein
MVGGLIPSRRSYAVTSFVIVICGLAVAVGGQTAVSPAAPGTTAPAGTATGPAGPSLDAQIDNVLRSVHEMTAGQVVGKLGALLQGDVANVSDTIRAAAYNAVGAANERLAQGARASSDPAAERKAQEYIDAAVEAFVKAGEAARTSGNLVIAEAAFGRALSYRPNNADALLGMARVCGVKGQHLQAIERYQEYFKAAGKGRQPDEYIELGRAYSAANLWNQAIRSFNAALINGETDKICANLADAYLSRNEKDDAARAVENILKAIAKNPTQPVYYCKHAQVLLAQKQTAQACERAAESIEVARKILAQTPENVTVFEAMSQCYAIYVQTLVAARAEEANREKTFLALIDTMREQAEVDRLLGLQRALATIANAPKKTRDNPRLLEKQVTIQKLILDRVQVLVGRTVEAPQLQKDCERLLELQPANKVARDILAALDPTKATASKPAS